jgi:hypothetical protein
VVAFGSAYSLLSVWGAWSPAGGIAEFSIESRSFDMPAHFRVVEVLGPRGG